MRNSPVRKAGLALALVAGAGMVLAAEQREEIGSASTLVPVERPGLRSASPGSFPPVEDGRVVGVELIRVIPIQGNNPFNPREPILNRDGQIITSRTGTGTGSGPVAGPQPSCVGASATFAESPTAPPGIGFAGIDVNPNTGACGVVGGGSGGHAIVLQSPPDQLNPFLPPDPTRYSYFVDALELVWTQIDPPPVGYFNTGVPGVPQTITIRATTGMTVRIQFTVTGDAPLNYQVRLDSLTFL